ncbi:MULTISPECIES: hypothetical protein [unclassified Microbacterium]|uniref:hypothetical protein n=1 Tax=unclassified Microbacterium TaxID=2609290 RepID=UPI0030170C40
MSDASTSLARTYRYLRIAIAGSVAALFVAIGVAMPAVGVLPSISHYFYSPARPVFVGVLIAVSVALFALSGRGAQRVLLDVAAVLAPLIAIIPTPLVPGVVPGLDAPCPGGDESCVPAGFMGEVGNGVVTYLIVGAGVAVLASVLVVAGRVERGGTLLSVTVAAVILLAVGFGWVFAREGLLRWGHLLAAVAFFLVIAASAVVVAVSPVAGAPAWLSGTYLAIAIALGVVVLTIPVYGGLRLGAVDGVFVGETVALVLFAAFWVVQSVQAWDASDPAIVGPRRPPAR